MGMDLHGDGWDGNEICVDRWRWVQYVCPCSADPICIQLTFKQLDAGRDDGNGVLRNERVLAEVFRLNDPETQTTFHYDDSARSFLKTSEQ